LTVEGFYIFSRLLTVNLLNHGPATLNVPLKYKMKRKQYYERA